MREMRVTALAGKVPGAPLIERFSRQLVASPDTAPGKRAAIGSTVRKKMSRQVMAMSAARPQTSLSATERSLKAAVF